MPRHGDADRRSLVRARTCRLHATPAPAPRTCPLAWDDVERPVRRRRPMRRRRRGRRGCRRRRRSSSTPRSTSRISSSPSTRAQALAHGRRPRRRRVACPRRSRHAPARRRRARRALRPASPTTSSDRLPTSTSRRCFVGDRGRRAARRRRGEARRVRHVRRAGRGPRPRASRPDAEGRLRRHRGRRIGQAKPRLAAAWAASDVVGVTLSARRCRGPRPIAVARSPPTSIGIVAALPAGQADLPPRGGRSRPRRRAAATRPRRPPS